MDAHCRRIPDQAGARNRENNVRQRAYRDNNAQGLSNAEDTVGHIASDHAADDNQRKVERQKLRRLCLFETEAAL